MNLFLVLRKDNGTLELVTPPLDDIILPGVTRDSVLALARDHASGKNPIAGFSGTLEVSERPITMKEVKAKAEAGNLLEVFGTGMSPLNVLNASSWFVLGTAAIICPVNRIGYLGEDIIVPAGQSGIGDLAKGFLQEIQGRQMGTIPSEWSVVVSE